MAGNQTKKRVYLSVEQKMAIVGKLEQEVPVQSLCREYGVSKNVIYRIHRHGALISSFGNLGTQMLSRKNLRKPSNEELENKLYTWFLEQRTMENPITDRLLREKAVEMCSEGQSSSFAGSRGWLHNFKKRYGICLDRAHEEKTSADKEGAKSVSEAFLKCTEEEELNLCNTSNMDERGPMWKIVTSKSLIATEERKNGDDGEDDEEGDEEKEDIDIQRSDREEEVVVKEEPNELEFSFTEQKRKDLSNLKETIKKYANGNQAILLMGEAMKKFLENESPQIT